MTLLDLLTNIYRNNGLPIMAVITPTGSPVAPITLPTQSQTIRNAPPNAADAGRRYLLSEPMKSLTIWGATNPTNPMTPVKLTTTAVMNETMIKHTILTLKGSVPIVSAGLSPTDRRLRSLLNLYKIDKELLSNYDIDAVIILYSSTYDQVETALAGTPVECVRIDPESTDSSLNTYLLMGFLLQKTERADIIVGFYDKYNKIIADKVAKIDDKKTSITMYSFSMCGTKYYLTENSVSAGTINLSDFEKNTQSMKDDMGAWAAVPKYQADYIIQYEGMSLRNDDAANKVDKYTAYGQYAAKMDAYPEHYFVVNKNMHDIARIAFTAGVIYEEEFGLDFAYDLYQELIEVFYPYVTGFDVRVDTTCVVTYDMVKDQINI